MSHYSVLVIGDYPESQLEPFDENYAVEPYYIGDVSEDDKERMLSYYKEQGFEYNTFEECYAEKGSEWNGSAYILEDGEWREYSTYNPDSKWDWYQLGGRWTGCFIKLKDGAQGTIGDGSWASRNNPGVDQARKKDIDFERIKKEAREEAIKTYREIAQKCGGTIPALQLSWKEIINEEGFEHMSWDEKRTLYHSQEAVKIWREKVCDNPFAYDIDDFQCTEEEYATRAELNSFIPYAVIYEGEWISRGDMGWWGITTNEHFDKNEWQKKVWELIDSVDDDTLFSFYDLHI